MDEDEAELRNPFPSPPSHYIKYTSHNLKLLALFRERTTNSPDIHQNQVLADQTDVPDWPLTQLEKPRVDWILDEPEAYYEVFGDRWFVKEKIPSLAELGGNQLYPADPSIDRRPALLTVLRSLLVAYSSLTSSLLAPPQINSSIPSEWRGHVEWINVMSQNIMAAANDLRPVQARGNLELMMKRQLELRKNETIALHSKCDALEAKLTQLRAAVQALSSDVGRAQPIIVHDASHAPADVIRSGLAAVGHLGNSTHLHTLSQNASNNMGGLGVTQEDVLRWAEEIG